MARGERGRAARALASARRAGITRREAEEAALMLVLHAGYPAALEGLALLAEIWPGRATGAREGSRAAWRRRGERLCRRVYGDAYPKLVRNVATLHPAMAAWMIEEGYGRVLSRAGLDARTRELIAVTVLAAGAWERQLVSHLLGARRMGCDPRAIRTAIALGAAGLGASARAGVTRAARRALGSEV